MLSNDAVLMDTWYGTKDAMLFVDSLSDGNRARVRQNELFDDYLCLAARQLRN